MMNADRQARPRRRPGARAQTTAAVARHGGDRESALATGSAANDLEHVLAGAGRRPDVPSGKIYDIADIAKDAHYAAREMIRSHRLKMETARAARHRAEDVGDARRHPVGGAGAGRAHRGSARSLGL